MSEMKRVIGFFLLGFLFLSFFSRADHKEPFDAQKALGYIKELASEAMMGRKSGHEGGAKAAKYIASKFAEWGLEPAGENGTYFQNFSGEYRDIGKGPSLEISAGKAGRSFVYQEDWSAWDYSGSGNFTTEIVFVGYGIHAPQKGYDDYAGLDLKGRLALMILSAPPALQEKLKEEADIQKRVQAAQELGARGVLLSFRPYQRDRPVLTRMKKDIYKKDFVLLFVQDKVVNFIFKDLKTDLRYLLQEMDANSKPKPYVTGVNASFSLKSVFDEKRPMVNVLAKISGADRDLKNQAVMIGAHMDHLGLSPQGDVMNGADDNASGTALVMELARVMKAAQAKPKRTILFGLWAAEEQFLQGSKYYTGHPLFPIDRTVAYLNIDMVGQGSGKVGFSNIFYRPDLWELLKKNLPPDILKEMVPSPEFMSGNSDHASFLESGVPGFALTTEGYHFKYHDEGDDVDLLKPQLLEKTADVARAVLDILTNNPGDWIPPLRKENYYLKEMMLINFKLEPVPSAMAMLNKAPATPVDLQLAFIEEKEKRAADALRTDVLNELISLPDVFEKEKGLSLFASSRQFRSNVYGHEKRTVMVGLKGVKTFLDNPKWTEVLAKQGIFFVLADNPSFMFDQDRLSAEGRRIADALNHSSLLLLVKGLKDAGMKAILEALQKPIIILQKDLPGREALDLIKTKDSALGLLLGKDDPPTAYFLKLDAARKAIGSDHLMIVNEESLLEKPVQENVLRVLTEILNARYEWLDIVQPFSRTFLRIVDKARGEPSR